MENIAITRSEALQNLLHAMKVYENVISLDQDKEILERETCFEKQMELAKVIKPLQEKLEKTEDSPASAPSCSESDKVLLTSKHVEWKELDSKITNISKASLCRLNILNQLAYSRDMLVCTSNLLEHGDSTAYEKEMHKLTETLIRKQNLC
jgi:hypothetical protein